MKLFYFYATFLAFVLVLTSCDSSKNKSRECPEGAICSDEIKTTETGLKYIHHIHYPNNRKPKYLEMLTMHYLLLGDKGDTLTSTYKDREVVGQELLKPAYKGSIEEGLKMLAKGDSATFYVNLDSIKGVELPIPKSRRDTMKEIRYVIKLYDIQSKAAYQMDAATRLKQRTREEVGIQDRKIKKFIEKQPHKDKIKKHPAGFYYAVLEEGEGKSVQTGDSVSFEYETYIIPNRILADKSPNDKPVGLVLGSRTIIPAWQIALSQLATEGSKIVIYTPSHLAFGNKKYQKLPAFTILQFELEINDIIRKSELEKL